MKRTLAMAAVLRGQGPMLELLAQKGADLDAPSEDEQWTPLMAGLVVKDRAPLEVLWTKPLRWDATDANGMTALFHATARGNEQGVKELLARGANPNHHARNGKSPLLAALAASASTADPGRFKPIVAALLDAGATIDFGEARAGDYAAQLSRIGIEPAALDGVVARWKTGCAANDLAACSKVGNMLAALGKNDQAEPPLSQSCEHGNRSDCHALGIVQDASGHREEAIRIWTVGCKSGDDSACTDLGIALMESGKPDEGKRALALSCSRGFGWACITLGTKEHQAGDDAAARKRFEKACENRVAEACQAREQLDRQQEE